MPIPSRRKGEEKGKFISRCISDVSKKDPNRPKDQIIAICNTKADVSLSDQEMDAIAELWSQAVKQITDLSPPLKKKKKDKYRITKKDGSGTDTDGAHHNKKKKKTYSAKIVWLSYNAGHKHSVPEYGDSGETSYDHGHRHKFERMPGGGIKVEEVGGHIHY
jgi:hypothetical protein